ncbi:putative acetyltransferase [Phyllobacterium sp. CL33Tsu]|uniref:GNAT family N-acetyltransferase n=1 Tax=Phyllobacterium sp. CL33Tsu TaxID=1798191 RepID=UPI0008E002B5|nr:GNAT family N-acetyltransferase [Phyllobacterium sp. CL33Tsu]SFI97226.1 putative acetyltransferase [Phyllobacterium sp. CL33Tsu]
MSEPKPQSAPEFLIRATRAEDVEQITALSNLPHYRAGTLRLPYQSVEQTRSWLAGHGTATLSIVAEINSQIVGLAGLTRFQGRRQHAAGLGIGVHDEFTGRGIGRALVGALLDAADNWLDIKRVELTVFTDNEVAIHLYETFGFEREGLLKAYAFKEGRYADCLAMARIRA